MLQAKSDEIVKSQKTSFSVIPATVYPEKSGIKSGMTAVGLFTVSSKFRKGGKHDDFYMDPLRKHVGEARFCG
jgi:hypothetical protein